MTQIDAQPAAVGPQTARRDWTFQVEPLHPAFGCEIVGMPLERCVDEAVRCRR